MGLPVARAGRQITRNKADSTEIEPHKLTPSDVCAGLAAALNYAYAHRPQLVCGVSSLGTASGFQPDDESSILSRRTSLGIALRRAA